MKRFYKLVKDGRVLKNLTGIVTGTVFGMMVASNVMACDLSKVQAQLPDDISAISTYGYDPATDNPALVAMITEKGELYLCDIQDNIQQLNMKDVFSDVKDYLGDMGDKAYDEIVGLTILTSEMPGNILDPIANKQDRISGYKDQDVLFAIEEDSSEEGRKVYHFFVSRFNGQKWQIVDDFQHFPEAEVAAIGSDQGAIYVVYKKEDSGGNNEYLVGVFYKDGQGGAGSMVVSLADTPFYNLLKDYKLKAADSVANPNHVDWLFDTENDNDNYIIMRATVDTSGQGSIKMELYSGSNPEPENSPGDYVEEPSEPSSSSPSAYTPVL